MAGFRPNRRLDRQTAFSGLGHEADAGDALDGFGFGLVTMEKTNDFSRALSPLLGVKVNPFGGACRLGSAWALPSEALQRGGCNTCTLGADADVFLDVGRDSIGGSNRGHGPVQLSGRASVDDGSARPCGLSRVSSRTKWRRTVGFREWTSSIWGLGNKLKPAGLICHPTVRQPFPWRRHARPPAVPGRQPGRQVAGAISGITGKGFPGQRGQRPSRPSRHIPAAPRRSGDR